MNDFVKKKKGLHFPFKVLPLLCALFFVFASVPEVRGGFFDFLRNAEVKKQVETAKPSKVENSKNSLKENSSKTKPASEISGEKKETKPPKIQEPAPVKTLDYRWTRNNLQSHWEKHGNEFPELHSADEYGQKAVNFFKNPPPKVLKKIRGDGERLQYDQESNIFSVSTKDGVIKTMFKPDRGINYWNRQ